MILPKNPERTVPGDIIVNLSQDVALQKKNMKAKILLDYLNLMEQSKVELFYFLGGLGPCGMNGQSNTQIGYVRQSDRTDGEPWD